MENPENHASDYEKNSTIRNEKKKIGKFSKVFHMLSYFLQSFSELERIELWLPKPNPTTRKNNFPFYSVQLESVLNSHGIPKGGKMK